MHKSKSTVERLERPSAEHFDDRISFNPQLTSPRWGAGGGRLPRQLQPASCVWCRQVCSSPLLLFVPSINHEKTDRSLKSILISPLRRNASFDPWLRITFYSFWQFLMFPLNHKVNLDCGLVNRTNQFFTTSFMEVEVWTQEPVSFLWSTIESCDQVSRCSFLVQSIEYFNLQVRVLAGSFSFNSGIKIFTRTWATLSGRQLFSEVHQHVFTLVKWMRCYLIVSQMDDTLPPWATLPSVLQCSQYQRTSMVPHWFCVQGRFSASQNKSFLLNVVCVCVHCANKQSCAVEQE